MVLEGELKFKDSTDSSLPFVFWITGFRAVDKV